MSRQVCHCGWAKVTTQRGLRTHQSIMGCTPNSVKYESSDQEYTRGFTNHKKDFKLDFYTPFKTGTTDDTSVLKYRVCFCGWSNTTTYRGLRIHQATMGCTQKGLRIPEREQPVWERRWEDAQQHQPKMLTVKKENSAPLPRIIIRTNSEARADRIKKENNRIREHPTPANQVPVVRPKEINRKNQTLFQTTPVVVKKEPESPIPNWRTHFDTGHQLNHDSSVVQGKGLAREHPTPTSPERVVRPKEEETEDQTELEDRRLVTRSLSLNNLRPATTTTAASAKEEEEKPKSPLKQRPPLRSPNAKSPLSPSRDLYTVVQAKQERIKCDLHQKIQQREEKMKEILLLSESVPDSPTHSAAAEATRRDDWTPVYESAQPYSPTGMKHKAWTLPVTRTQETGAQPTENVKEVQRLSQNVPDWTTAAAQIQHTSAEVITEEPPEPPCETAQPSDSPAAVKTFSAATMQETKEKPKEEEELSQVKSPMQMFSAATIQETAVRSKEEQQLSQVKSPMQMFSAATIQETAVRAKEEQQLSQNMQDPTRATNQIHPTSAEATTEEDPESPCEAAVTSPGMKVKDLAQMFSAATIRQRAVQPKEKRNEERKLSQNVPDSPRDISQMNPASPEATTEEDPESPHEAEELPVFSPGIKVKDLAQMFSAATIQETAVRPKERPRVERKLSQVNCVTREMSVKPKTKEDQSQSQNVPHSTNAMIPTNPGDARTEQNPESPAHEAADVPDFSPTMKVKDLAQMFSAAKIQEAAVRPKERPRVERTLSQVNRMTRELAAKAQHKEEDCRKQSQANLIAKEVSAARETAAEEDEEDHKHFNVKELAQMFSAAQETAARPQGKTRRAT